MTTATGDLGEQHEGRAAHITGAKLTTTVPGPVGILAPTWRRTLPRVVALCDLAGAVVAALLALRLRFGAETPEFFLAQSTVSYVPTVLGVAVAWPGVLAALGAYRTAVIGSGPDEMGRAVEAGLTLFAAMSAFHLLLETNLSGRLVALLTSLLVLSTVVVRVVVDAVVRRARLQNRWRHRAVVYGPGRETSALVRHLRQPALAVDVVGTCVIDATDAGATPLDDRTDDGSEGGLGNGHGGDRPRRNVGDAAIDAMAVTGADLLAVAGGTSPAEVRALAWALEGTGAELMIAPSVPDLAQQRVVVEAVGGVVMLRVEQCRQRRGWLVVKSLIDRVGAAVLLLVLSPVLAGVAIAIKLKSPGPILFRQERVGRYGKTFEVLKFRTMVADADARVAELLDKNDSDGFLFKVRDDPRVTDLGRVLRRLALDELPQLWNVLRGDMSLVGPRPLAVESGAFVGDERRRLRVRPGITGLWQVSGGSELPWDKTVTLDMHYVDHWSLALDLAILARTPLALVRGRGAY